MTCAADGTTIVFNESGDVNILSEGQTYVNATGPITITTAGDAKIKAAGKLSFKAAEMEFEASKLK